MDRPYPACSKAISQLDCSLKIKDLLLETRHTGQALIVRRFGPVATSPVGGTYGVEDEAGTVELLLVDAFSFAGDHTIPVDAVIAIKEPYCKVDGNGNPRIKLSHPSDLMVLPPDHEMVPLEWRMDDLVISENTMPSNTPRAGTARSVPGQSDTSATEVRETQKAGRGLFSKKVFRLGDQILTENAAILLSPHKGNAFTALKYDLHRNMMIETTGAPYKELALDLSQDPDMATQVCDLFSAHVAKPCSSDTLVDGKPVIDIFHVHEIWSNNAIACPATSEDQPFCNRVNENSPSASGLWCRAAYCNHSCLPNAEKSISAEGVLTLRATRDIKEGEEITISYGEYVDQAEKQQALYRIWGFKCDCPVCEAESQISERKSL